MSSSSLASDSSLVCQSLPRSRSSVSSDSRPPFSSASMMASCNDCIEWPSSPGIEYPSSKPLDSMRSESRDSSSSRSTSSRSSPVNLEYRYFTQSSRQPGTQILMTNQQEPLFKTREQEFKRSDVLKKRLLIS